MWLGRLAAVREHVRHGLLLYDRDEHRQHALIYGGHDPAVCGYGQGALALWLLGYPDQAARSEREGVDLAESLSHTPSVGHALWWAAVVHYLRRDVAMALELGERLIALGNEHSLQFYQAVGGIMHGWALATRGRGEEGLPELRRAVSAYGATSRIMIGLFTMMLAEAELGAGSPVEAVRQLDVAEHQMFTRGQPFWRAAVLHRKGEVLAAQDATAAEPLLQASRELARGQQAKSLELRASTSLARLWREKGNRTEARDLLAPIYGWFTEGFDTPDLKEAKALLESLS